MAALSNAERQARWRERRRAELPTCPRCGEAGLELDDEHGWCWLCRKEAKRERGLADAGELKLRRAQPKRRRPALFVISPLGFSHRVNGSGAHYTGKVGYSVPLDDNGFERPSERDIAAIVESPRFRYVPKERP